MRAGYTGRKRGRRKNEKLKNGKKKMENGHQEQAPWWP
jgi:hypothetical protein